MEIYIKYQGGFYCIKCIYDGNKSRIVRMSDKDDEDEDGDSNSLFKSWSELDFADAHEGPFECGGVGPVRIHVGFR